MSLVLCFMVLVIFLAELKLAFSKIENVLISALISFCFLLSGLAASFFILSFICSNSFSTRSLMVSLKPSIWSPSTLSLIMLLDSKSFAIRANNDLFHLQKNPPQQFQFPLFNILYPLSF